MTDLRELYQETLFDHNRRPRNQGRLEHPSHHAEGHNPLCGDRLSLTLELDGDIVRELRFEGEGCAISIASASLMTEALKGRSLAEVERLHAALHALVTGKDTGDTELGKLAALAGVAEFPMRVKCATLAWHTLQAALRGESGTATTE